MDNQKFCLKWDGFHGNVTSLFDNLRQNDELVDITLCCEGQRVRAHRMMLSACSPYFRDVLKEIPCQQMVIFLKDTSAADLQAIVEFMYKGSVNVAQSQLASFIKTAEMLQIRGLSGDDEKAPAPAAAAPSSPAPRRTPRPPPSPVPEPPPPPPPPPAKRRRVSTLPASGAEAPPPQVIDCTLSPDPEHPAMEQAPGTPAGGLGQHAVSSPIPSPSGVSNNQGSFLPAASQEPLVHPPPASAAYDTSAYDPAANPEAYDVKVEKVEQFSGEEDSGSLGATLEHVAEYEGEAGYGDEYPSLEMGGAVPSMGHMSMGSGPSQRGPEDGSQQGGAGRSVYTCRRCPRVFINPSSLSSHMRVHDGVTKCPVCGQMNSNVSNLRRHMRRVHKLSEEGVQAMTPS